MATAHITFPKWEEVLSGLIESYRIELDLPDSLFEEAHDMVRQLGSERNQQTSPASGYEGENQNSDSYFSEETIADIKSTYDLESNQFLSIESQSSELLWVDDKISQAFGFSQENHAAEDLLNWNELGLLYHPMDALHVQRYEKIKRLLCQLGGIMDTEKQHYFSLRFRMVTIKNPDDSEVLPAIKLIERRKTKAPTTHSNEGHHLYINKWTVINDHERHKAVVPSIEILTDSARTRFLNALLFLFNAKSLGFSPKDIMIINYNSLYDGPEESRASLNRDFRRHHNAGFEFEVKPFTDSSYYLNKKLTAVLEKNSMEEIYKSSFYVRLNRLGKASRLGLIPMPRVLREIILSKVYKRTE
jgi:hypothetical protein